MLNAKADDVPSIIDMRAERIEPGPGQESVWDYPRPPRIEDVSGHIRVTFNNLVIADTHAAKRVLETSHPHSLFCSSHVLTFGH